jgi:hypothetical protein
MKSKMITKVVNLFSAGCYCDEISVRFSIMMFKKRFRVSNSC